MLLQMTLFHYFYIFHCTYVCVCVCVYEYIFDVSLDSLEEHTNSVTWRVRLGRSDRGLHIFYLIYLITIKTLGVF